MARPPLVEPVPDSPASTLDLGGERALVVGDYHAGIEAGLRYERGVELPSNGDGRRERLQALLERTAADRLVVLGDLGHRVSRIEGAERDELDALYDSVVQESGIPMTVVPGNHDGGLAELWADEEHVEMLPQSGGLLEADGGRSVGLLHGHTWPDRSLLSADVICMAHEHPTVKLQDSVGGYRTEKAWLRGRLDRAILADGIGVEPAEMEWADPELVVLPAFNERSGGTWINVESEGFLAPFLPDGLDSADCYLLDGTRLGDYRSV